MAKKRKSTKKKSAVKSKSQKKSFRLDRKTMIISLAVVIVATVIAMYPVINADFTEIDDKHLILEKTERVALHPKKIINKGRFTPHYKPLVTASWLIERNLFNLEARTVHINNLILHVLNTVLFFFITLKLAQRFDWTRKRPELVAVASAVLFGVHPMHVESVAWAVERKDVLYTLFFLLGLLSYMRYVTEEKLKWMAIAAVCFLASAMSKASAIAFPVVLFAFDYAYKRKLDKKLFMEKWMVFLVLLFALYMFGFFGTEAAGTGAGAREGNLSQVVTTSRVTDVAPLSSFPGIYAKFVLAGLKGIFWYLHTLIPVGQSLAYPYKTWLPAIGHGIHVFPWLLALGAFALYRVRDKYRLLVFAHMFFFAALLPALIRTGLGKSIFLSDRYVYLASFGLLFGLVGFLHQFMQRKSWDDRKQYVVFGMIAIVYGVLCFSYARKWDNGETLWTNTVEKYPSIAYAWVNRAMYYKERGMTAEALSDFNAALAIEDDPHALVNRGTMLRDLGRYNEAMADFDRLLANKPSDEYGLNGKGNLLFTMGRYQEAVDVYTYGISLNPRAVNLYTNRSAALYYLGQYAQAIDDLNKAQRLSPRYPGINQKKTVIYMGMKDWTNAVESARLTSIEQPNNHANLADWGKALQNLGRHQEAIEAYTRAITLFGSSKRYYNGRARSYQAIGNKNAAQQDRQKARSL